MKRTIKSISSERIVILLVSMNLLMASGCGSDEGSISSAPKETEKVLTWGKEASIPSEFDIMWNSAAMLIRGKVYIGTGRTIGNLEKSVQFWEFDPELNEWKQLGDFVGGPVSSSTAFVIGNSGYLHTWDLNEAVLWKYNALNDEWEKLLVTAFKSFISVAFSINDYGYLLDDTGRLWRFDPLDNSFLEMAHYPLQESEWNFSVVANNVALVGGGQLDGVVLNKAFMYDPDADAWTSIADLPLYLVGPTAFALSEERAFVGMGSEYDASDTFVRNSNAFYEYNFDNDSWDEIDSYPGIAGQRPISFSYNNQGYVFYGANSELDPSLWKLSEE